MLSYPPHANTSRLLKKIQMSDTALWNVGISRSQIHYNLTQRGN